ncbi:MAG: phosphotransferase [Blautia sp.]|uniref:phosphotransferase n=1 Tax=unclassified Blautia TaxID=2648079 RepID=UPI001C107070|nr:MULTISPECIES: phosphotransferase [unclassified Blautia]MBU5681051.1 phosphotransferase [Blautia sp. MSJ-9]MCI6303168.1 phosphotransferase [Blautia sp.]MCI7448625.1 phosphotransferase [Blautia sp.]MDD6414840.1 phosphotransferase [Blautia sp.]MDY4117277.1 phosphotransferase [Blautia sp.]
MSLYDYGLSTLAQYELTADRSARTRGALLCYTSQGLLILREFHGSEKKLKKQQELLLHLKECGMNTDYFLQNTQESLVSKDKDQMAFTLQHWYEGRECDTKSRDDIIKSVRTLARLHILMKMEPVEEYRERSLRDEYLRHNQELRKIRKFIRKKGASSVFEKDYLASVEWFLQRAQYAVELLDETEYDSLREKVWREGQVCHGEYNQHNVLMLKGEDETAAVTNFGHWNFDIQMADLYRFMRKILEKYNWNLNLAQEMLREYHRIRPISKAEWQNLRVRFTYPEKYWKLANYYYSHKKVWISEKNVEKLQNLIRQRENWKDFAQKCFEVYPADF